MNENHKKISKALIIGSGGLQIGQAGEFDYSGSQAIKALKTDGIKTILINPNVATVQTGAEMADSLYSLPLTFETARSVIVKEKPDGILLGFGGQTALNLGLELHQKKFLDAFRVRVLGTPIKTILITEDRWLFKQTLDAAGLPTPQSRAAATVTEALRAARSIGYPLMIRSGFSLGGMGSGIARDEKSLRQKASEALNGAPQIIVEECLEGWKEIEYEMARDVADNAIAVCNMENMDPMGVHTGDSIVVAPSQTLNNREYYSLRAMALKTVRLLGIIGECNIQFALHPASGDIRIIEVNARLSRSSALASKATGYPLAFVAAKLALGWRLDELQNNITKKTSAFFEPAMDYLVVKIPRWDNQKFRLADRTIGSEMKSVGEVMAIGRSFPEALQKAVRMLNLGYELSDCPVIAENYKKAISRANDQRLFALYQYFKKGGSESQAHKWSKIDPWFLRHLRIIAVTEKKMSKTKKLNGELLREAKQCGFSDRVIALLRHSAEQRVRRLRQRWAIAPVFKIIDTAAGEFPARTNYLYATYHGDKHDAAPLSVKSIIVIGSGPYCVGSSVEFDWCAVNSVKTLQKLGRQAIVVNSNPETVSTDYDESDRLYFEELTLERIADIADFEHPFGLMVSVGGQIANNLAGPLHRAGYPILGTSSSSIDMAENRKLFSRLLENLRVNQPEWQEAANSMEAARFAGKVGFPLLIRPSFVLSGAAMQVLRDETQLQRYFDALPDIFKKYPLVVSRFIEGAREFEMDGAARTGKIVVSFVSEHIEEAGVHSGDASLVLPSYSLNKTILRQTDLAAKKIVRALNITGPFNIQFLAKDGKIYVIECNLRAARSFPFVSKTAKYNLAESAVKAMLNKLAAADKKKPTVNRYGIKMPQFSYSRLKGADPVAGVEMHSTGEVACFGKQFLDTFYLSWLASGGRVGGKRMLLSLSEKAAMILAPELRKASRLGWIIFAPRTTAKLLDKMLGRQCVIVVKDWGHLLAAKSSDIVFNIQAGADSPTPVGDEYKMRRIAVDNHIPLVTNLQIAKLLLQYLLSKI